MLGKEFVVVNVLHREGVEAAAFFPVDLGGDGGDGAGVETAGQQRAERHVGNKLAFDSVLKNVPHHGDGGREVLFVRLADQFPVPADRQPPPVEYGRAAGLELGKAPEYAVAGGARRPEHEDFRQAFAVEFGGDVRVSQQGFDLGGEQQPAAQPGVEERFDAQAVAGQEEALPGVVPYAEGEDAVETLRAGGAPLDVRFEEHLGVGGRGEGMAAGHEVPAQVGGVVEFAVVDHDVSFAFKFQ